MRPVSFLVLLAVLAGPALAQERPTLTIEQITQRPETWVGAWPSEPFWTDAGDYVYFEWNPGGAFPADSLYRVAPGGGEPEPVPADVRRALPPPFQGYTADGSYSPDRSRRAFTRGGDVFVLDVASGRVERVTRTPGRESGAAFLADGSLVYRSGDALVRMGDGLVAQVTDLREGRERPDSDPGDQAAYLRDQQRRLFDVLRERARLDSLREAAREAEAAAEDGPPTYYVGDREVGQLSLDPSGRFVAFTLADDVEAERTLMVDYVTETGAAEEIRARPKVGAPRTGADLFVQDLRRDTTVQIDLTALPGAFDAPDYWEEAVADSGRQFLPSLSWAPGGGVAVLDVRTVDNKDRWLARLDAATGGLEALDRQRDEAWVAGPGISWWGGPSAGGFLPDGRYWFHSERTGWSHLYAADLETGAVEALTEGDFEVEDATLSRDGRTWLLQTSEGDLGQRHLWTMPNEEGGWDRREKVTEGVGRWDGALSPDGDRLALLYSTASRPPEVYVAGLEAPAERVTDSATDEWEAYPWREAEIVQIPASDGAEVPARIYRPDAPNGAAVLFVHGAGYLQNAHRWWSSYVREYQFHHLLADAGYLVLDLDYRASAGYGRDWRTAVYRHMGGRDLGDYVDASRWVGEEFGIGPERVAIYGGSYGGFLTLMALFTEPEHFGGGAALRSVTDWAHYNDTYTRNILNTPVEDPEAYLRSSPIEFAAGLEDPLLMTHGLVDDNVQPQDIFRLSQRLIELGKRDWELAIAPVEPHGYTEPTSWADKLHRIYDLIEASVGGGAGETEG